MQIFASSPDPVLCAAWLDDKRVRKMVVETAQLLSTAIRHEMPDCDTDLYKPTAQGKALWTWARVPCNLRWLAHHGRALCAELDHRGLSPGKFVRTRAILANCLAIAEHAYLHRPEGSPYLPGGFVNATRQQRDGVDFTHVPDANEAYRLYLDARWAIEYRGKPHLAPRWTNRPAPPWHIKGD